MIIVFYCVVVTWNMIKTRLGIFSFVKYQLNYNCKIKSLHKKKIEMEALDMRFNKQSVKNAFKETFL